MTNPRLDAFRAMLAKNPRNALAHFGLANEAAKAGLHEEAVEHLQTYLGMHEDEGNAYGRLAESLRALGRDEEAREALRRGIDAANRFGHPSMAAEFDELLDT
ncbi:MAG TPA: tetratricopeptide repeat protein [Gemmatimonadaceae bacterium]|nr:tetratricopeptide repeat protein [Gemmatimonadaceae bacterium]